MNEQPMPDVVRIDDTKIISNVFGNVTIVWGGLTYMFGTFKETELSVQELLPEAWRISIKRKGEKNTLWFDTTEEKAKEILDLFYRAKASDDESVER